MERDAMCVMTSIDPSAERASLLGFCERPCRIWTLELAEMPNVGQRCTHYTSRLSPTALLRPQIHPSMGY